MKTPRELLNEVKQGEEEQQEQEQQETVEGFDGQVLIRKGEAPIYV